MTISSSERAGEARRTGIPRKRWNNKGSFHAKQRMSELRARKARLATMALAREFCDAVGAKTYDETRAALVQHGYRWEGWSEARKQEFYRSVLAALSAKDGR